MAFEKGNKFGHKGKKKRPERIPDLLRMIGAEIVSPKLEKLRESITDTFPHCSIDNMTNEEVLQRTIFIDALAGDVWSRKHIAERTEGRVPIKQIVQNIDVLDAVVAAIQECDLPEEHLDKVIAALESIGEGEDM